MYVNIYEDKIVYFHMCTKVYLCMHVIYVYDCIMYVRYDVRIRLDLHTRASTMFIMFVKIVKGRGGKMECLLL